MRHGHANPNQGATVDELKTAGRPSKTGKDKREHRVAVYLNSDEAALLAQDAAASGHTLAVRLRLRALESIRRSSALTDIA